MTTLLIPDKKLAIRDADTLLNGDLENALRDPDNADPMIEEIPTHPEDGEEDVATLRLVVGGEYTICECPPLDGQPSWDVALAIKQAGLHIHGLVQENERLEQMLGKDLAQQNQTLLVALKKLREEHARVLHFLHCAVKRGDESTPVVQEIDAVIAAAEKKLE